MPFSFHHFIEESQGTDLLLSSLWTCWIYVLVHDRILFLNISSFPLNTVFHFCKEYGLFTRTSIFLQKTQALWFCIYTRLQLMVMDRNIMHCMGIFVTPLSAIPVTLAISSFNLCKLWHLTNVWELNTVGAKQECSWRGGVVCPSRVADWAKKWIF
jgi:hypothetical protein